MTPKIIAAIATLLLNIAAGVAIFFILMMSLNGYRENDAAYGLSTYAVLAGIVTISMTAAAFYAAHQLLRNGFRNWVAILLSTMVFSIFGTVLKVFFSLVGIGVAEYYRANH